MDYSSDLISACTSQISCVISSSHDHDWLLKDQSFMFSDSCSVHVGIHIVLVATQGDCGLSQSVTMLAYMQSESLHP